MKHIENEMLRAVSGEAGFPLHNVSGDTQFEAPNRESRIPLPSNDIRLISQIEHE